ncbi:MAG TPA: TolC family protein [Chitinophagaceae bacterium]|nr:TolC family protein [Chitinophagaceae bacterium]
MNSRKSIVFIIVLSGISLSVFAQDKWDLRKCVEYALLNNITVKQQDVQALITELTLKQSKLSQYPTLNFSGNSGYSAGRNQDPTNFSLITQGFIFSQYTLQASVDVFNWFRKKSTIAADELNYKAAKASVDKLKNDIAFNVAAAYLQALLTNEQVELTKVQISQTQAQLTNTRKLVEAGSLPELNAAELEAQLARDSSNYFNAKAAYENSIIFLKANLSLDMSVAFDIDKPNINAIPLDNIADLQPDAVYELAIKNQPQQLVNQYKIASAKKSIEATARGSRFPNISIFGSLGTSFNSRGTDIRSIEQVNNPIGKVNVSGTDYSVFPLSPRNVAITGKTAYFTQIDNNFRQSIGVAISIPILSGGTLKTSRERTKLDLTNFQLQKEADDLKLKQDIYKAYTDAVNAIAKYNANVKTLATAKRSFELAGKRYDLGLLNTIEYVTSQNNVFKAQIDLLYSQYDYVFKIKVLEFYKGQGLRL